MIYRTFIMVISLRYFIVKPEIQGHIITNLTQP
jgi:hypothetical protein